MGICSQLLRKDYGFDWMEEEEEAEDMVGSGGYDDENPSHTTATKGAGKTSSIPSVPASWLGDEQEEQRVIELLEHGDKVLVARGGKGGQGNVVLSALLPGAATVQRLYWLLVLVLCTEE